MAGFVLSVVAGGGSGSGTVERLVMHASILRSFDDFTRAHCSPAARAAVAELLPSGASGLFRKCPDVQAMAAIALLANAERRSIASVLESYGQYFVRWAEPEYPDAFAAPDARAFLSDVAHFHELVKRVSPGADAPDVSVEETEGGGLTLRYGSPRGLCALARGMIQGVGEHYGEAVSFEETACVAHGAQACRFEVRFG
jgi:predicted hydrocarbon binding protein